MNKSIIFPLAAAALLMTSCDDNKMDWHTPDGHYAVVSSDIPLSLAEKIAKYDYIKNYMTEYMPNVQIGLGIGADKYLSDSAYADVANKNFQIFTPGNAMKHSSVVKNDGTLDLTTVSQFITKCKENHINVYGHNFLWHTQQNSTYLKSLIAPDEIIESDGDILSVVKNGDFETGQNSPWISWGNGSSYGCVAGVGVNNSYAMKLVNPKDARPYDAQFVQNLSSALSIGTTYILRFKAKCSIAAGQIQTCAQYPQNPYPAEGYKTFDIGTKWKTCEVEFTVKDNSTLNRLCFNFGAVAATYYIDEVEFGTKKSSAKFKIGATPLRTSKTTYTFKTAEEKREALLGAMKNWITGMAKACPDVKQWDVINEPIADGSNGWRGIDNVFGGKDDDGNADKAPTENATDGLTMNWANDHWYWGYYLGKDYAVKAFQYARDAIGSDAVLYVNDYNLETSPSKLAALIDFVNYIDQNGGHVDGIGTQMHLSYNGIDSARVATMFKTLAATGKMVRITELDVSLGTATPSVSQQQAQSDVYQMVMKSYKENIPESQRGGICIWGLSDATDEHTYWLPNCSPNIFDASYARKIAYKGICDGIAGKDLGASFTGDMWH